eukprot:GILK01008494.1.p1 GENE.GILK01008494.1~~GILK01008494.1.p1  ORF type:complete len:968 (-),score=114.45 GILK01008494.1:207-3110(-)
MDDFEMAVLLCLSPTNDPVMVNQALAYCNQVKESADGWKMCAQRFATASQDQVRFFCLQVIEETIKKRYSSISYADKSQLRAIVLTWLTEVFGSREEQYYMKSKFSLIIALLVKFDYPESWPTAFQDLMNSTSKGPLLVDIFLNVLHTIDQEVVQFDVNRLPEEHTHNTLIKDTMRETVLPALVDTWYHILVTYCQSHPRLASQCLDVIQTYIDWIEITLIVNQRLLTLFFNFLSDERLRGNACRCLEEVVQKRMDPIKKLAMLSEIQIIPILKQTEQTALAADEDELENSFGEQMADLVSSVATELFEAWEKLSVHTESLPYSETALSMLNELMPTVLKFFDDMHFHVSDNVHEFVLRYVGRIHKKPGGLTADDVNTYLTVLQIVQRRVRYPEWFTFSRDAEEDSKFFEYRKNLGTVFKSVTRALPEASVAFLQQVVLQALQNASSIPMPDLESALFLFFTYGETHRDALEKMKEGIFPEILQAMITNNIIRYPHHEILLEVVEIFGRYHTFFVCHPQFIGPVLAMFLDERGIRSSRSMIRSRFCCLLLRFVKATISVFQPFAEQTLASIKDLLPIVYRGKVPALVALSASAPVAASSIASEDQASLYEVVGVLIGAPWMPPPQKGQFLQAVIAPMCKQIEEVMSLQIQGEAGGEWLYSIVEMLGYVTKGFNSATEETSAAFMMGLEAALRVVYRYPQHTLVRFKVIMYLHRMLSLLPHAVLPFLQSAMPHLLAIAQRQDIEELIVLLNQAISALKGSAQSLCQLVVLPLLQKVMQLTPQLTQTEIRQSTDEAQDRLRLLNCYYGFIHGVALANLSNVFIAPENLPHVNQVLTSIVQGCMEAQDAGIQKLCFSTLSKLVDQWGAANLSFFRQFILDQVVPVCFQAALHPLLDVEDHITNQMLNENLSLQKLLLKWLGPDFVQFVCDAYLHQSLHFPVELIHEYRHHLEHSQLNHFRDFFKTRMRGS